MTYELHSLPHVVCALFSYMIFASAEICHTKCWFDTLYV